MVLSSSTTCQAVFGAAALGLFLIAGCSRSAAPGDASSRVMLRSAELRCEVDSLDGLEPKVQQLATELGGFVVRSEREGSDDAASLSVSLRVPSAKLDTSLIALGGLARKVESRHESGEDFTDEYVDGDARRRNLDATRGRLLALLERADKVDDALAVNRGLSEVQAELDKVEGREKYLERSAAMSTVSATFHLGATPWRPFEVARGAVGLLLTLLRGLANLAIVVAVFAPVWGPLAWLIRRLARRPAAA